MNIFTFNDLHGYLVENPIKSLIIRRHIVFLVWFIKRAWAACGVSAIVLSFHWGHEEPPGVDLRAAIVWLEN